MPRYYARLAGEVQLNGSEMLELRAVLEETISRAIRSTLREIATETRSTSAALDGAEYISVQVAARRVGVHPSTIRKLIACGKLRRYEIGSHVRVRTAELDELMRMGLSVQPSSSVADRAAQILRSVPSR